MRTNFIKNKPKQVKKISEKTCVSFRIGSIYSDILDDDLLIQTLKSLGIKYDIFTGWNGHTFIFISSEDFNFLVLSKGNYKIIRFKGNKSYYFMRELYSDDYSYADVIL